MKRIALTVLLVLLLANPADLSSCGPFFPSAVFTRKTAPDDERAFFGGNLGILQPTYERRYLAVAYRILSGEPLSKSQIDSVVDLYRLRTPNIEEHVAAWLKAARQVDSHTATTLNTYRRADYFIEIPVCGADAFDTAIKTLTERSRQAGADSAELRGWVQAQNIVFSNCEGKGNIPDPAPAGSSERVAADREYQIAAAYFYSEDYGKARDEWTKIAADKNSPWRAWAPYLIARSYLRAANYNEAATQLKQILASPDESSIHKQTQSLLDYAMARLNPGSQLSVLANRLLEPDNPDLAHDLNDYTFIYDRMTENNASSAFFENDLTAWITEFQHVWAGQHRDAADRWQKTKSLAWLLAAEPSEEILEALREVPASSPAYATARSRLAVALTSANKNSEAAKLLDETLTSPAAGRFDLSAINQFHAERMRVAENFEGFLKYAPRKVIAISDVFDTNPVRSAPEYLFDDDAASVFNQYLPLGSWRRAADTISLPPNLRVNIAQAGWVRSILIDSDPNAFANALAQLKPSYTVQMKSFASLASEEKRFAEIFWMLHHPELNINVRADLPRFTKDGKIDDFRDNWWCDASPHQPPPQSQPPFITPAQKSEVEQELDKLNAAGAAREFLSRATVEWAAAHPDDSRNPEALALAVKTSRYGCGGDSTYVERAFRLLHSRYPNSTWAKQTPYWFK
ncbi:MAG TPA: hypothetical protein VFA65_01985 [Bryobacteraceae bacterium]|nr:hypothetical protein [Bryobacteraceae bacterium]